MEKKHDRAGSLANDCYVRFWVRCIRHLLGHESICWCVLFHVMGANAKKCFVSTSTSGQPLILGLFCLMPVRPLHCHELIRQAYVVLTHH